MLIYHTFTYYDSTLLQGSQGALTKSPPPLRSRIIAIPHFFVLAFGLLRQTYYSLDQTAMPLWPELVDGGRCCG